MARSVHCRAEALRAVQIHSPDVPDLTVVDLPGTTTIPMKNQPASIVADLENMALHYIGDPNSIILAVTPANADVANSQALQLATRVDPSHNRTIGVLTKIDLMDRGTNATDILNNRKFPLKLGWVGVVNRSQQDIDGNKTLTDAKNAEKSYFHGPESPYKCACTPAMRPLVFPSVLSPDAMRCAVLQRGDAGGRRAGTARTCRRRC